MSNVIKTDAVNHPAHYNHGGMETIDVIKHITAAYPKNIVYQVGTVVKYLDRAPYKDNLAQEIRFIRGRLKFVGAASSAPFPSAILIFKQAPKFTSYGRGQTCKK
ncbi:MAG: DUF3310 domain-containing protein [Sporolactobacillus sp.]